VSQTGDFRIHLKWGRDRDDSFSAAFNLEKNLQVLANKAFMSNNDKNKIRVMHFNHRLDSPSCFTLWIPYIDFNGYLRTRTERYFMVFDILVR